MLNMDANPHLESLTDRLDRSTRTLRCNWLSGHRVIHVCGNVELQQLRKLADDVLRRAILLLAPQLHIRLHDLRQLVRQVVLTPA